MPKKVLGLFQSCVILPAKFDLPLLNQLFCDFVLHFSADCHDPWLECFQKSPSLYTLIENNKQLYYRNRQTKEIEKEICQDHPTILSSIMEEMRLK